MYLKSLELYGFKSFPDRTKLLFEKGTTIIVGPNGSGKSNISDAMKWVLGEISTKSIRGSKMEDIIFSGTESRKPMSFAEVSVTFDNTDPDNRLECPYDEVTVTRRYYRVGESEYFINRRAVRLRDIYELFMNTGIGRDGYSIIGQGKIAEIISRKSEERRGIFEDASGIAKFRFKKNEAERKLAQTTDNLTRVNDIFVEVESRIGPLEKEANKARRAIEHMERKKEADIRLWLYDSERLRTAVENATDELARADFELQTLTEALDSIQAQNESILERSQSNKASSQELLERIRKQTRSNYDLESEYRLTERNIAHTRELIEGAVSSIESYERMLESEQNSVLEKRRYIDECGEKLSALELEHTQRRAEKETMLKEAQSLNEAADRAFADLRKLEEALSDIRTQIAVLKNASASGSSSNDSAAKEIGQYEAANRELLSKAQAKEKLLATYNGNIESIDSTLAELSEKYDALNETREQCVQAMSSLIFKRDSVSHRIDTYKAMEEQLEGYLGSVKYIMKAYADGKIFDRNGKPCGTVYGPISKLITVEDEYLTAVEIALGASLQHIVVEDDRTAKAGISALKEAQKGRATFLPITSMKGQTPSREVVEAGRCRGYISTADKLVKYDDRFTSIISSLLSRTLVFDNIENANDAARQLGFRVRIVTLDGQQINIGGSFTGGYVNKNAGMLTRVSEIKHLEEELEELEKSISSARTEADSLDSAIEDLDSQIGDNENNKHLMEAMAGTILPEYEKLKAQIEANNTLIEKMRSDLNVMQSQRAEYDSKIEDLSVEENELLHRVEEVKAFREAKVIETNTAEDAAAEKDQLITEIFIEISAIKKDIETQQTLLESSDKRIAQTRDEISSLQEKKLQYLDNIKAYEASRDENRRCADEGERLLSELNSERAALENTGAEYETRMAELNSRMKELMSNKEIAFRERTMLESKLINLKDEQDKIAPMLMDEYNMTRSDALKQGYPVIADETEKRAVAAVQTECRNKLRAIGHVDLDAVEKYNELKTRYDEMSKQLGDLREAEGKIRAEIKTLENQMESTFLDAFNKINENFGRVFSELFGGGHAEIILTEPDDVLSSGIEIKAAPPGKIIKSLMQLSGGEQSFVAIALFFATLQVNPTPFCILDEIEAALDEANVARFASYIKRYSDDTQFIVISHRRGTMEAAERLYGVTMPERGISKVLSLVVSEIAGKGDNELNGLFG